MKRLVAVALIAVLFSACGGDDDPVTASSSTTTSTTALSTTTTAAPTTTTTTPGLTASQQSDSGSTVTVHELQVPAQPNRRMVLAPGEDGQFAAVDVELCAGSAPAAFEDSQWLLVDRTNRRWEFWNVQDHTHDPRVGFQTVRPGECARGWVSFLIAKNAKVQKVTWDESGYGEGPYLDWMVR